MKIIKKIAPVAAAIAMTCLLSACFTEQPAEDAEPQMVEVIGGPVVEMVQETEDSKPIETFLSQYNWGELQKIDKEERGAPKFSLDEEGKETMSMPVDLEELLENYGTAVMEDENDSDHRFAPASNLLSSDADIEISDSTIYLYSDAYSLGAEMTDAVPVKSIEISYFPGFGGFVQTTLLDNQWYCIDNVFPIKNSVEGLMEFLEEYGAPDYFLLKQFPDKLNYRYPTNPDESHVYTLLWEVGDDGDCFGIRVTDDLTKTDGSETNSENAWKHVQYENFTLEPVYYTNEYKSAVNIGNEYDYANFLHMCNLDIGLLAPEENATIAASEEPAEDAEEEADTEEEISEEEVEETEEEVSSTDSNE